MLAIVVLVWVLAPCEGIENAWFSVYGEPDYARPVSQGTDWGEKTRLGCSRMCGQNTGCSAFQFKMTNARLGSCVVFGTLTLRKNMVSSPGTQYYEKRTCELGMPIDATVMHFSDYQTAMFSGPKVRVYKFNIVGTTITSVARVGDYSTTDLYQGYTNSVDAAFEFIGTNPTKTILLKGTKESCFQRATSGAFTFSACADTHYLSTFFASSGLSRVDSIAVDSTTSPDLHVTASGIVYHLRYSSSSGKFEMIQNHDMLLQTAGNPWSGAFKGVTAMFRLTYRLFYLFEGSKYVKYDTVSKQFVGNPLIICGD
ncbi:uncharacterized protein [Haliotis cracherodii]|uniref:uncharacterized protein n=1 Tax=Haliotis cracherodii TaxID=6455 RepID=UPI0039E95317